MTPKTGAQNMRARVKPTMIRARRRTSGCAARSSFGISQSTNRDRADIVRASEQFFSRDGLWKILTSQIAARLPNRGAGDDGKRNLLAFVATTVGIATTLADDDEHPSSGGSHREVRGPRTRNQRSRPARGPRWTAALRSANPT